MLLKGKKQVMIILLAMNILIILAGCSNEKTPVEKMHTILENVVAKEKSFEEQQEPLVSLEKKEKELYDQIIALGMKDYDKIVKLSDEALSLTEQRKKHMEKETNSIKESEQEFKKAAEIKEEFEDADVKRAANELYDTMMERYRAHEALQSEYSQAIENDKQLYQMFKDKNLPLEQLEAQVTKVNETYKKVFAANENFNKLTEQYNGLKLIFYEKAELTAKK